MSASWQVWNARGILRSNAKGSSSSRPADWGISRHLLLRPNLRPVAIQSRGLQLASGLVYTDYAVNCTLLFSAFSNHKEFPPCVQDAAEGVCVCACVCVCVTALEYCDNFLLERLKEWSGGVRRTLISEFRMGEIKDLAGALRH